MDMYIFNIRRTIAVCLLHCLIMISYVGEASMQSSQNGTDSTTFCHAYPCKDEYICDTGLDMCVSCVRYCHKRVSDDCATKCKEHTRPKIMPERQQQAETSSKHTNNSKQGELPKQTFSKWIRYTVIVIGIALLIICTWSLILYAMRTNKLPLFCKQISPKSIPNNRNCDAEGNNKSQRNEMSPCLNNPDANTQFVVSETERDNLEAASANDTDNMSNVMISGKTSGKTLLATDGNASDDETQNDTMSDRQHTNDTHVNPTLVDSGATGERCGDILKDEISSCGRIASCTSDVSNGLPSVFEQRSMLSITASWARMSAKSLMSSQNNVLISRSEDLSKSNTNGKLMSCDDTEALPQMFIQNDVQTSFTVHSNHVFHDTTLKGPHGQLNANSVFNVGVAPSPYGGNMLLNVQDNEASPCLPVPDDNTTNHDFQNAARSPSDENLASHSAQYLYKEDFNKSVQNNQDEQPIHSHSNLCEHLDSQTLKDFSGGQICLNKEEVKAASVDSTKSQLTTPPGVQIHNSRAENKDMLQSPEIDSIGVHTNTLHNSDDYHSSNINIYASASELMIGQPMEANNGSDSSSDNSFTINLSLHDDREDSLLICQPSDAIHDPNYLSHIEYDEPVEGAVGGMNLPHNRPVHDNDTDSHVSYIPRSMTDDSAMASMYDPAYMNRDGFHLAHMDNNPVYEQLQGIPWVMGYHSEGRSISVYADLDIYDVSTLQQQLIEATGQPATKFKLRQNAQV